MTTLARAIIATSELFREAKARGDTQAARYYAQALRCLLGPSRNDPRHWSDVPL